MDEFTQFFERCESIGIQSTYFDFLVFICSLLSDCYPLLQMDFNTLLVLWAKVCCYFTLRLWIISHLAFLLCKSITDITGTHDAESFSSDEQASRSMEVEEKEREHKPDLEVVNETEQYKEYVGKSIQELDLSNCECCTPSYRLLPSDVIRFSISSFIVSMFIGWFLTFYNLICSIRYELPVRGRS